MRVGAWSVVVAMLIGGWSRGLPEGDNTWFHLVRSAEFITAAREGQVPPQLAPRIHHGTGYPIHMFYPPLLDAVVLSLSLSLGATVPDALRTATWLSWLVLVVGSALLSQSLFGGYSGPVSGIAIGTASYTRFLLLDSCAFAELLGVATVPWTLWAVLQCWRGSQILFLAISYGGTILSHNGVALVLTGGLVALGTLFIREPTRLLRVGSGLVLGLGFSCWFWLPALLELKYVQYDRVLAENPYHASFLTPRMLWKEWGPVVPSHVEILLSVAILTYMCLHVRRLPYAVALWAAAGGVGMFMSSTASRIVWEQLTILHPLQFPYRFLSIFALAFAILLGWASTSCRVIVVVAWAVMASSVFVLHTKRTEIVQTTKPVGDIVSAHDPPVVCADEFLPRWCSGETPGWVALPRVATISATGRGSVHDVQFSTTSVCAQFDVRDANTFVVGRLYFPGWTAYLNGVPTELEPSSEGMIRVRVPKGNGVICCRFQDTPCRKGAKAVSIASALFLFILLAVNLRRAKVP